MTSESTLYFDYNATAPLAPGVLQSMLPFLEGAYHNPSSASESARPVRAALQVARKQVAQLVGAQKPDQIRFTSGGTESIHAAFHQACHFGLREPERNLLLHSAVEHSATKGAALEWKRLGFEVQELPVDSDGLLQRNALHTAFASGRVALLSLIVGNNETGVLQDLDGLAEACVATGAKLHLDAVQLPGKLPLAVQDWGADWVSISGHKFGAPKGVGALYSRNPGDNTPWLQGGGQESKARGGTENVAGIVGMGQAAAVAAQWAAENAEQHSGGLAELRDRLEQTVCAAIPGACVHGLGAKRVPNTTFLGLPGQPAEFLLPMLEDAGLLCSAGSACDATHWQPSPVLLAMGVEEGLASASLRLSLGPQTDREMVDRAARILIEAYRILSPEVPAS